MTLWGPCGIWLGDEPVDREVTLGVEMSNDVREFRRPHESDIDSEVKYANG